MAAAGVLEVAPVGEVELGAHRFMHGAGQRFGRLAGLWVVAHAFPPVPPDLRRRFGKEPKR